MAAISGPGGPLFRGDCPRRDTSSYLCHSAAAIYRANALPSAGSLPFMQTLMCDLGGGSTDDVSDMPQYRNATCVCA